MVLVMGMANPMIMSSPSTSLLGLTSRCSFRPYFAYILESIKRFTPPLSTQHSPQHLILSFTSYLPPENEPPFRSASCWTHPKVRWTNYLRVQAIRTWHRSMRRKLWWSRELLQLWWHQIFLWILLLRGVGMLSTGIRGVRWMWCSFLKRRC